MGRVASCANVTHRPPPAHRPAPCLQQVAAPGQAVGNRGLDPQHRPRSQPCNHHRYSRCPMRLVRPARHSWSSRANLVPLPPHHIAAFTAVSYFDRFSGALLRCSNKSVRVRGGCFDFAVVRLPCGHSGHPSYVRRAARRSSVYSGHKFGVGGSGLCPYCW